jgi:hypothetical protein
MIRILISSIMNRVLVQGRNILVLVNEPIPFLADYDLLLENNFLLLLEDGVTRIRQEGH